MMMGIRVVSCCERANQCIASLVEFALSPPRIREARTLWPNERRIGRRHCYAYIPLSMMSDSIDTAEWGEWEAVWEVEPRRPSEY